ncbi:hypothetical protein GCM10011504_46290 [Siccirubricoccus deserti]|uniref:DUF1835 domain-containing protein n=1 Tax=Siccirubricoccus deserti TaxID=2013562 RepID=A0A9X0R1R4_9PROT|nr:hypothetical protein [Siccirubricoccus deserti]MBC4018059.1 hypothetical protein [Siccirubricoccus deserti]GGC62845.1 hypothetical protein GCM10011504_46290 [Siccirubricoccus deserti]
MQPRLHLRCGDDLRVPLQRAGIAGEYLCFSDPVCQGPARDEGDLMAWLGLRARFVALHAGQDVGAVRLRLGREYTALSALHRHDAVWLWFEHDLWDQAALIRVLSLLAEKRLLRGRLWLLPADGVRCFPELSDVELGRLQPAPLTELQIEQAAEAWAAYSAPDPTALDALSRRELALPFLGAALRRHLRDLPWTTDGLAETERLVLRAVAEGVTDEAGLLRALRTADAVFHQTDLILRDVVGRLRLGPRRLLHQAEPLGLTPRGAAVLAGRERHRPPPRSEGGVSVLPDPPWLYDPARAGVVRGAEPGERRT